MMTVQYVSKIKSRIRLRWFKWRTVVVALEGEAVSDADGVAGDVEEEELMSSV